MFQPWKVDESSFQAAEVKALFEKFDLDEYGVKGIILHQVDEGQEEQKQISFPMRKNQNFVPRAHEIQAQAAQKLT